MNDECNRWAEISDRQAVEGELSIQDTEFLTIHVASCSACAAEQRVFEQLRACLDESKNEMCGELISERPVFALSRTPGARRRLDSKGLLLVPVAAAVALVAWSGVFSTGQGEEQPIEAAVGPAEVKSFAQILLVSGEVTMEGSQPSAGASLAEADTIVTAEGRACITHGAATTCLESHSRGRILEARAGAQRVELAEGTLVCRQASATPQEEFEVKTKWGTLVGLGARFVTAYTSDGVSIALSGGRLLIVPNVGPELVVEGRRAVRLDSSGVSREDVRAEGVGDGRFGEMEMWDHVSLTPVALSSEPTGATVRIDGVVRGSTPLSMMTARGSHRLSVEHEGFSTVERVLEVKGAERVIEEIELTPSTSERKAQAVVTSVPSELLAEAQKLRKQGRYADAARTYQALLSRHPSSREAAATRLSLAELQLSQLGAPAVALGSFRQYLKSGGALRQEASYGEIRALRALGREVEARHLAQKFVSTYPDSGQAVSLGRWLRTSSSPSLE